MRNLFMFIVIAGLFSLETQAQNETNRAAQGNTATAKLNGDNSSASPLHGKGLMAELTKSLDASKLKVGDEVRAKVTDDVASGDQEVVRKGSKLIGHVTEASAHTKENPESRLGVVFDKVLLPDGREIMLHGAIQGYFPPVPLQVSSGRMLGDDAMDRASGPYIDRTTGKVYQGNPNPKQDIPLSASRLGTFQVPRAEGLYLDPKSSVFRSMVNTVKLKGGAQVRVYVE
jgi:hypothetical protein